MPGLATPEADHRLDLFLDHVTEPLRNDSQRATFAAYAVGLLSDAERKSMEPLAARARPDQPGAAHKAFCYLTSLAVWDDAAVRRRAAAWALWGMTAHGPVLGTIVDDTGMLKQGGHSVGVARQYTGSAGKVTNCQIAVTLAVYTARHAVPIDASLYLPESWIQDPVRRREARIPESQVFQTKGEIALAMLKAAHAEGVPLGKVLLGDADYGRLWELRDWCREIDLRYAVGVHGTQRVWDTEGVWTEPMTVADYTAMTEPSTFRRMTWRLGSERQELSARFAFLRVCVTREGAEPTESTPEEWLVIEWRDGEPKPQHFYLCDLPGDTPRTVVVRTVKERWRIEAIHSELKGEVGFDHFEGRSWPGWNHHVTLALCCHALLIAERCVAFPPFPSRRPAPGPYRRPTRPAPTPLGTHHPAAPRTSEH